MAVDMQVVRLAYSTAVSMGASEKVLLALFEAGIVESGFKNLNYGDRDSVGFLQQRPSQGWQNPMDVPTATRSFVSKAMAIENRYSTAGQLAQAVQRSAFPLKYDAVRSQAATLLAQVKGSTVPMPGAVPLGGAGPSLGGVDKLLDMVADKQTWLRVAWFIGGAALVWFGVFKLVGVAPTDVLNKVST